MGFHRPPCNRYTTPTIEDRLQSFAAQAAEELVPGEGIEPSVLTRLRAALQAAALAARRPRHDAWHIHLSKIGLRSPLSPRNAERWTYSAGRAHQMWKSPALPLLTTEAHCLGRGAAVGGDHVKVRGDKA